MREIECNGVKYQLNENGVRVGAFGRNCEGCACVGCARYCENCTLCCVGIMADNFRRSCNAKLMKIEVTASVANGDKKQ